MDIIYSLATKEDINELIRLRIAYILEEGETLSDDKLFIITHQLTDYFHCKLENELIAFVAKYHDQVIATAYLHIIEMPANASLLNGRYGKVLSVYTDQHYRGVGICSHLMEMLVNYGKTAGLGKIDLSDTNYGYPVYKKVGFKNKDQKYIDMRYTYEKNS